jgi:nicotinic acid mononucleotide adenylyltransferase
MIALKQLPLVTLSSTFIRESVKNGKDIGSFVPKPVADYIKEQSLYAK